MHLMSPALKTGEFNSEVCRDAWKQMQVSVCILHHMLDEKYRVNIKKYLKSAGQLIKIETKLIFLSVTKLLSQQ